MCNCLSFLLENPTLKETWVDWAHSLALLCGRWSRSSADVELFRTGNLDASPRVLLHTGVSAAQESSFSDGLLEKCGIHVIRRKRQHVNGKPEDIPGNATQCEELEDNEQKNTHFAKPSRAIEIMKQDNTNHFSQVTEIMQKDDININGKSCRMRIPKTVVNGGDDTFSVFTRQGLKGTNQDSMLVWEDFIPSEKAILCGVFDGHGPHGHHISRNVRDTLPLKIASCWQALQVSSLLARSKSDSLEKHAVSRGDLGGDPDHISLWEETFHNAYKQMDRELLVNEDVDSVFSGSTAVTLVKQGNDLIIANVGDSRAVLGVKFDNSLLALQLTVDLTPNLPKEAERIRRCKGRVLALRKEPFVKRVWLPHENTPGLAMAMAFGDYILKNFGVISVPEVTHRRISKNDKFVVLATDGVWDVLSNEQVVRIVDSCPARSLAAQAVVDTAVRAWKVKYPDAKVDDCAVVCLFLDSFTESWQASNSPW